MRWKVLSLILLCGLFLAAGGGESIKSGWTMSVSPAMASGPTGGFSSGSWNGTPQWNSAYHYGIIDAGGSKVSADCSWPGNEDSDYAAGTNALNNAGVPVYGFWFLTSNYFSTHYCGNNTTPTAWGADQATFFYETYIYSGAPWVGRVLADVETGFGADWTHDTPANNQAVIYAFNHTLCFTYNYCADGIYSSRYDWEQVVGQNVDPYEYTSHFWLASYDPSQTNLNQQEDYFTNSPGGYVIFSWQYTDDSCYMTYSSADTEATNASPAIPQFDKWTNSQPNVVC